MYDENDKCYLDFSSQLMCSNLGRKNKMVITHGNGPQAGNLLLASEAVGHILPPMPLDVCGAATQGMIGYT